MNINLNIKLLPIIAVGVILACQPAFETPTGGKRVSGNDQDKKYMIATGSESDMLLEINEAFNSMDVDAMWAHMADTVTMRAEDGSWSSITKEDFAGYFGLMDSVKWGIWAVIPVQLEGDDQVDVYVQGREARYFKDGTIWRKALLERFIFQDGKVTGIRQWSREVNPN